MRVETYCCLAFLIATTPVSATPLLIEPCEEKVLVTRTASPVKPSPILAWVTVRSGRPGITCTDETLVFDVPEPEIVSFDPEASYSLVTMPIEPEPSDWPTYWSSPQLGGRLPSRGSVRPPASVPEPGSLGLLSAGLLALVFALRKRSERTSR